MKPMFAFLALAVAAVSGQRRANTGYGAPPAQQSQPQYGNPQPQQQSNSLADSQQGGSHDHQGLDWLLESVPGQPGTDYPIYADANQFSFDCNGQVEGGYYANIDSQCQAFHVCVSAIDENNPEQTYLSPLSFLCPNGTIFNQEYFICDWWFNFDCSQAQGLYSINDQVEAERQQASAAASNNNNNYVRPSGNNGGNNNFGGNNNNFQQSAPANNNYQPANSGSQAPLQQYGRQG